MDRRPPPSAEEELPGYRSVPILVADADRRSRAELRRILDLPEYEIIEAASGEEALRNLLVREFAVLLVDANLPGIPVHELATLVASRPRSAGMPVVFLVEKEEQARELLRLARSWGSLSILTKPLRATAVRAKVGIYAELSLQRAALADQALRIRHTDELEKELALRQLEMASERRYRSLADAVPNIVWTADPDGNVDYFNRRWFEFTGLTAQEGARPWIDLVHPDDRERCRREWREAVESASMFEGEFRLRRKDGSYRWHLARAMPETGQTGRVVAWLGTFTDISEQKRAERERERLYSEAVDALRARDDFVSEASHELRTPVTSLGLMVQTLRRRIERGTLDEERLSERLRAADHQLRKLDQLIRQLLDVSRMKSGPLELQREFFDLGGLVRELAQRFEEDARQAGCDLEVSVEAELWGQWDRLRIDQALTNLITNALKFGRGAPVRLEARRVGDEAQVKVIDHGMGISKADQERIFDRFARTREAHAYGGMGLGLYIVRQIVDAHEGRLEVESEPGRGVTFTLALPLPPDA